MNLKLLFSLAICLAANGLQIKPVTAQQVTSDGTTGTTVTVDGNNSTIQNGTRNGGNLFHSFQDFSIPNGGEAFFDNALEINNILSRVTGGNVSNIDGLIRANGNANLFLINPAGIIFGSGARLDIGGSFYGSTADSILFEDGEFSAVNNLDAPILTINAPIGLNLRNNPSPITNQSFAQNNDGDFVGLEVLSGQVLGLIGGDVNFESGEATASGGLIAIGGLLNSGTVSIQPNGSLTFPENVARANVSFSNLADVDVRSTGGGSISVNANNINISGGDFGGSVLQAGITADSTSPEAQSGDITLNATGAVNISGNSALFNNNSGTGNAGNINITAASLSLANAAEIGASTFGTGNAGNIAISVNNNIEFTDSNIFGQVAAGAVGEGGTIALNATNLSLLEGSQISAGVFGTGNAGNITIDAINNVTFQGVGAGGFASGILNNVDSEGIGNAGSIDVTAANLNLIDGGTIQSNVLGQGNGGQITINANNAINVSGFTEFSENTTRFSSVESRTFSTAEGTNDAGNIDITANSLSFSNQSSLSSSTSGNGDAGNILLNISGTAELSDSDIFSQVAAGGIGEGGTITLNIANLSLLEGSQISAGVFGTGNAGNIAINAADTVTFQGIETIGNNGFASGILNNIDSEGTGNAGNINVTAANLNLVDGGTIRSNVSGTGNGGQITIDASNAINVAGFTEFNENTTRFSSIESRTFSTVEGTNDAGNIDITANSLSLSNQASFSSSTSGNGNAGNILLNVNGTTELSDSGIFSQVAGGGIGEGGMITLNTTNLSLLNGSQITAGTSGTGNAGNVDITTDSSSLSNGSFLSSSTSGNGNAGNILLSVNGTAELSDSNIFSQVSTGAQGEGGTIAIDTTNLSLLGGSQISAGVFGTGNAGNITVDTVDNITFQGIDENGFPSGIVNNVNAAGTGNAGNIDVTATNLDIVDGGTIRSNVSGQGNGGQITINANNAINVSGFTEFNENTTRFSSVESRTFSTAEGTNNAGNIAITAGSLSLSNQALLSSDTSGNGNAGNIDITAGSLSLSNQAFVSSDALGNGNAGNILLNVNGIIELIDSDIFSQVAANGVGNGGTITVNTTNLSLLDGSQFTAAVFGTGNAGTVTVNAVDNITFQGIGGDGFPSGILSDVARNGVGNAGNIDVTATNLNLVDGGTIGSSVFGEGNGGQISINASNAINIAGFTEFDEATTRFSSVESRTFSTAEGTNNAGKIDITTGSLSLSNQAFLSSDTLGNGNAGNISIQTIDSIVLDDASNIVSNVTDTATGDGGEIAIQARNLFLRNGSEIITQTLGQGEAGNISIDATDSVEISGVATFPRSAIGNPGGFSSGLIASTEAGAGGNGGEIVVTTSQLELSQGGVISGRSRGGFTGGNITINADTLDINSGGQILATAFSSGDAGDINLNVSDRLSIEGEDGTFTARFNSVRDEFDLEQANFTVDTINQFSGIFANTGEDSTGNGGTITVFAQDLTLDNQGQILAETNAAQPEGTITSDITLSIADNLILRGNSTISAASDSANGGDITINAADGFVVAFPNQNEGNGNDISAFSSGAAGGNIIIEAQGVLGLQERDINDGNNTNDIDASGNLDNGNVEIITPDTDAIQGANQLPSAPVESNETVAQACSSQRGIASSNLVIMGKGGVPHAPSDTLQSEIVTINDLTANEKAEAISPQNVEIATSQGKITPAQGVEITPEGEIILTAYQTQDRSRNAATSIGCS